MSVKNPKDARRKMKDERRKTEDARCKMQDERHHSHSSYSPIALFLTQEAEGKNSGCLVHDMAQLVANPTRVVYNYYLVPLVSRNHHGKTNYFSLTLLSSILYCCNHNHTRTDYFGRHPLRHPLRTRGSKTSHLKNPSSNSRKGMWQVGEESCARFRQRRKRCCLLCCL